MKKKVMTTDANNVELELAVLSPSAKDKQAAKLYSLKAYSDAVQAGVMISQQLDKYLAARELWDDTRQKSYDMLRKQLLDGELALEKGGIRKAKAREIALKMVKDRAALTELLSVRSEIHQNTADAIAEQAYFNSLVASCTVYNSDGKPYFTSNKFDPSVDAFVEQNASKAAIAAAEAFAEIVYSRTNTVADLPENKFLKTYHFIDDQFNLIDSEGRKIDEKGRLINDEGFFIDKDNNRVDIEGNPVGEDGRYKVEFKPFLEDDDEDFES